MTKTELLEKLNLVRPALSSKEFVPVFTCFCFTGDTLFAFNDLIAIETELKWPVQGAVKGTTLLEMTKSLADGDVNVVKDEDSLVIKAGRSKVRLPLLSSDEFIFSFPDDPDGQELELNEGVIAAFKLGLLSSTNDPSHPERMGVTLIGKGKTASLYSTDGVIVTEVALGVKLKGSYILPHDFCRVLVDLADAGGKLSFHDKEGYVVATLNGCRIFSKLIQVEPVEFEQVFSDVGSWDDLVPIPTEFSNVINRAGVVMLGSSPKCIVKVENEVLYLTASSSYGDVEDSLSVPGHEDVEADIHPASVSRILSHAGSFRITEGHILLQGDVNHHLVGNYL